MWGPVSTTVWTTGFKHIKFPFSYIRFSQIQFHYDCLNFVNKFKNSGTASLNELVEITEGRLEGFAT